MAAAALPPPPLDSALAQGDGRAAPAWARWLQQIWESVRGDPGWTTPTLLNDWVNYNSATHATAAYQKDASGFVHLKGLVKDGSGLSTIVFTLPAGYRPALRMHFGTVSDDAFGYFYVDTTGDIVISVGSTAYFSLDTGTFKAEQ